MVAVIIKGNEVAEKKRAQLTEEVVKLKRARDCTRISSYFSWRRSSISFLCKGKEKGCEQVGIYSELIEFPETITEERLLAEIDRLNGDDRINGILVQLPLPKHIEEKAIIERISPEKDVDGFHPISVGRMMTGQDTFLPCTPHGIVELVKETNLDISGKHVVVIGRSNIVGKPIGTIVLK
ncbi:tetrahydrofolate dehydrogenase/cyclohydrolase catalytic domain-containing protein [Bacillus pacificus]